MGLTACKDCGAKISTSADVCPSCGGKVVRTSLLVKIIVALLVLGFIASFLPSSAKAAPPVKSPPAEMVAVYLGEYGDPKKLIDLSSATAVIYQERKCNLETIPFYQRMRYATMSGVPVCASKSGASVFIVGAGSPVELPEPFFAQARVTSDGASAEVTDKNYDGKAAAKAWMDQQRTEVNKQIRGATKPPRDNGEQ